MWRPSVKAAGTQWRQQAVNAMGGCSSSPEGRRQQTGPFWDEPGPIGAVKLSEVRLVRQLQRTRERRLAHLRALQRRLLITRGLLLLLYVAGFVLFGYGVFGGFQFVPRDLGRGASVVAPRSTGAGGSWQYTWVAAPADGEDSAAALFRLDVGTPAVVEDTERFACVSLWGEVPMCGDKPLPAAASLEALSRVLVEDDVAINATDYSTSVHRSYSDEPALWSPLARVLLSDAVVPVDVAWPSCVGRNKRFHVAQGCGVASLVSALGVILIASWLFGTTACMPSWNLRSVRKAEMLDRQRELAGAVDRPGSPQHSDEDAAAVETRAERRLAAAECSGVRSRRGDSPHAARRLCRSDSEEDGEGGGGKPSVGDEDRVNPLRGSSSRSSPETATVISATRSPLRGRFTRERCLRKGSRCGSFTPSCISRGCTLYVRRHVKLLCLLLCWAAVILGAISWSSMADVYFRRAGGDKASLEQVMALCMKMEHFEGGRDLNVLTGGLDEVHLEKRRNGIGEREFRATYVMTRHEAGMKLGSGFTCLVAGWAVELAGLMILLAC